jgi:hypothetical protein
MMVLKALLDVNLTLLHSDTNKADLPLNRTQHIHHLRKTNIIQWRRSSLRGGGYYMLIILSWRRLRSFTLTLKTELSIRLHESLTQ